MSDSNLILHRGTKEIGYDELKAISAPPATATWHPVAHVEVFDTVSSMLETSGFCIAKSRLGLSRDGHRFFGTLDLTSEIIQGVGLAVGVRNSTDQTFPIGFCAGSRTFVCDNLAFSSDLIVKRKHTRFGRTRFAEAITLAVKSLGEFQTQESHRLSLMQDAGLDDVHAESLLLRAYELGILSHRVLPEALKSWREPGYDWGPPSLFRLYQAMTLPIQRRATSNPQQFALQTMRIMELIGPDVGQDAPVIDAAYEELPA